MLDSFLTPTCNYNVLVIDGPPGSGKTTKLKFEFVHHPEIEQNWQTDEPSYTPKLLTLEGKQVVKIIDPADGLDIPKEILRYPCKYIFICNDLNELPAFLRGTKVMHVNIPAPTRQELLDAVKPHLPPGKKLPESIKNYNEIIFFIQMGFPSLSGPQSMGEILSFEGLLKDIVDRGNPHPLKSIPPYWIENLLNMIILNPDSIDQISFIDFTKKSGLSEEFYKELFRNIVLCNPKMSKYQGVFVKKKKDEKPKELEFEITLLKNKKDPIQQNTFIDSSSPMSLGDFGE